MPPSLFWVPILGAEMGYIFRTTWTYPCSPRVSHSNTCRFLSFVCFVFCLFVALLCFWFLFCKCLGIPNSPCSLDLDDRQGLIARSAMQQKKKMINRIQDTLRATMGGRSVASAEDIVTLQLLCQEVGCPYHEELQSTACCVALVVLWMGLHQEKFPLLATTLQAAAGVSGPQKWTLILPSSARVSLVTYTAVIAVRYPELDNVQNDLVCFGNYLLGEQATSGGFLPLLGCSFPLYACSHRHWFRC